MIIPCNPVEALAETWDSSLREGQVATEKFRVF